MFNRVVRTFHPIGQGAFYSERFYEGRECVYNIVYDCGVETVQERHKKVVRSSFSKDDSIDYLFISHLDTDHISLVKTWKESVGRIKNVVLPYIDRKSVALQYSLSLLSGDSNVWSFWKSIKDVIDGGPNTDETRFIFVGGDFPSLVSHRSGKPLDLGNGDPDWVFIPYNRNQERKSDLDDQLTLLLADPVFKREIDGLGLALGSLADLKNALISDTFAELIDNRIIKKKLQEAYQRVTGTINGNSLLVYSGPSVECDGDSYTFRYRRYRFFPFYPEENLWYHVACLYTGDSDFDLVSYEQDLGGRWNNVGTIQLPHHGSLDSFQYERNKEKFDRYFVFPISCGETNRYGHPSGKVLSFLFSMDCVPIIITENSSTLYMQLILRHHP